MYLNQSVHWLMIGSITVEQAPVLTTVSLDTILSYFVRIENEMT